MPVEKTKEKSVDMSIEVSNLNFSYGEKQVLRSVSLSILPAETLTILGPNGAGKTTLLNVIVGLLAPSSGSIMYNGESHRTIGIRDLALMMGFVPQMIVPAFDYSVLDYVVTGCAPRIGALSRPARKHFESAMLAIDQMGISHLTEKSYRQISGGERQLVSIARALAQSPAFIFMDEPTSHLDYGNQIRVLNQLKQLALSGFGVVFTTHNPDQALLIGGKTAIISKNGRLVSGDSQELICEETLSDLYGTRLRIFELEKPGRKVCFAPGLE